MTREEREFKQEQLNKEVIFIFEFLNGLNDSPFFKRYKKEVGDHIKHTLSADRANYYVINVYNTALTTSAQPYESPILKERVIDMLDKPGSIQEMYTYYEYIHHKTKWFKNVLAQLPTSSHTDKLSKLVDYFEVKSSQMFYYTILNALLDRRELP